MGSKINYSHNEEKNRAIEILEKHKRMNDGHYWIFALTTLGLSCISLILYIFLRGDKLIITPIIPVIFGIVGIFESKTVKAIVFSILSAILGFIFFLIIILI